MSLTPKTPIPEGAIRYNTDSNKMELWNGQKWMIVSTSSPDLNGGTRGMFHGGGSNPGSDVVGYNVIQMINISSQGDSTDFGDLLNPTQYAGACSSRNRSIIFGGQTPSANPQDVIQFTTIASGGNAQDFGNMSEVIASSKSASNNTRAVMGSGYTPSPSFTSKKFLDFITISSTGNANDFGDLQRTRVQAFSFGSPTRGIWGGGYYMNNGGATPSPYAGQIVDGLSFITIASQGDATDYGDLAHTGNNEHIRRAGCSNATRGLAAGGNANPYYSSIHSFNISSLGNGVRFGGLNESREFMGATASAVRGVWAGGNAGPYAGQVSIQYAQIATEGKSVDFGDLATGVTRYPSGSSNGHGGL
tara:strand:+ start:2036 stop:3118 length:1083 start_codon:yes stop_codon:yes gene_type:complete